MNFIVCKLYLNKVLNKKSNTILWTLRWNWNLSFTFKFYQAYTVFQRVEKVETNSFSFYEGNIILTIQDKKMLEMEINVNIVVTLISKPLVNLIKQCILKSHE